MHRQAPLLLLMAQQHLINKAMIMLLQDQSLHHPQVPILRLHLQVDAQSLHHPQVTILRIHHQLDAQLLISTT